MDVATPSPPVPSLPVERSRPHQRRRSMPSSTRAPETPRKSSRSPNKIGTKAASPEIITSLIDSLAGIEQPAYHLPSIGESRSTPASPSATQTSFGSTVRNAVEPTGWGMDYGAFRESARDNNLLYPDEACEPPVIRTSKPPSGLSPVTAPKKERDGSLAKMLRAGSRSTTSLASTAARDDDDTKSIRSVRSIGNISVHSNTPARLPIPNRTSSDSTRSKKGHKSLMYMSSREKLRVQEDRKRKTIAAGPSPPKSSAERLPSISPNTKAHSPNRPIFGEVIKEEPGSRPTSKAANVKIPTGAPGQSADKSADSSPVVVGSKGIIPDRRSSWKQQESPIKQPDRKSARRKSERADRQVKVKSTVMEEMEDISQPPAEPSDGDDDLGLNEEDTEVTRRIKELRRQKKLREKANGKRPAHLPVQTDIPPLPITNSLPTPSSPVPDLSALYHNSKQSSTHDTTSKAHKILGIAPSSPPTSTEQDRSSPEGLQSANQQPHSLKQAENGTAPVTPVQLPLDYQLAMQKLNRTESRAESRASTTELKSLKTTLPDRRRSVSVGGRSAVSRKTRDGALESVASSTPSSPLVRSATTRSNSADFSTSRSLEQSPRDSAGGPKQPTRANSKKKRWSHPDLPLAAEQRHNKRVSDQYAVKPPVQPPTPVIEEMRTSIDSVDAAVEEFLHAPRLSQKVAHPVSGRVISFSEVGDPRGFVVFCCVGMGLTRFVTAFYDELAATLRLRLITPERPGIGESQADASGNPLNWPDDVAAICEALNIKKFSVLAHSAGAIYALATALRMSPQIRGKVHLLAPWIPPSQMSTIGMPTELPPAGQLPRAQRFLRVLPTQFLKFANSDFMSATSASITRSPQKKQKRSTTRDPTPQPTTARPSLAQHRRESMMLMDQVQPNPSSVDASQHPMPTNGRHTSVEHEQQRQQAYESKLMVEIWDLATTNANPAVDLLVCLERQREIGFRYVDITRSVVIHHGSKDQRVPAENVKWLGRTMRKCEVRILEGAGHGLMADAVVMGNVLTEMAGEWEEWTAAAENRRTTTHRRRGVPQ